MAIKVETPTPTVLAHIVADVRQVTGVHMHTGVDGTDYLEIQPTLAETQKKKIRGVLRTVVAQIAPLPTVRYEGAKLKDLMADAFTRAKAHESAGAPPAQAFHDGVRDAIYARLEADNAWSMDR